VELREIGGRGAVTHGIKPFTATEDYLPGAFSGAAFGYDLPAISVIRK
jgi:hypothetical protein